MKRNTFPSGPNIRKLLEPHLVAITQITMQVRNDAFEEGRRSVTLKSHNLSRAVKSHKQL